MARVGPVVGQEGDAGELARDFRIGAAEAVGQLRAELGPVRIPHDHGGHRARPAQIVTVERFQEPFDILPGEPADVVAVIDVAGGRPDEDQRLEAFRLLDRRQDPDGGAHRVADEDHLLQIELAADFEHVGRVALERAVPGPVVGGQVRLASANVVEEDDPVLVLEGGRDEPPHVLVAAEAVGENHRPPRFAAGQLDVVSAQSLHERP